MTGGGRRLFAPYLIGALALVVFHVGLVACEKAPTPPPMVWPSPRPTSTPSPEEVLEEALFTISFKGNLLAIERIKVGHADQNLLVFSETQRFTDYLSTERRTVVLSGGLNPLRYDLEISALGTRSTWVAERRGEVMDCFSNNMAWYGPVLAEGISPAPGVMLESSPSALPFALLTLRLQDAEGVPEDLHLHCLDISEDYPTSRPLTVTVAPEGGGAVIGTVAYEGSIGGGPNQRFTMWIRPRSRLLYGVEMPDFEFGLWQQAAHSSLRGKGALVIKRVGSLPDLPEPPEKGKAARLPLEFSGADKTRRAGTLILPPGDGPFPCLVAHSAGGVAPRWDPGDVFAERGWAVYCYDKGGVGESEGDFDRGRLTSLAGDAVAAGAMLSKRPELDPARIVFLGLGEGGQVGALAMSASDVYAAAVLGSCATMEGLFPALVRYRIRHVLAPFYQWDAARTRAYEDLSIVRWQEWLYEGKDEVVLLRRRASLRSLQDLAAVDLLSALSQAKAPVLLLHGEEDQWTPVDDARELASQLRETGAHNVVLRTFSGLGADLGGDEAKGVFAAKVEETVFAWLEEALSR